MTLLHIIFLIVGAVTVLAAFMVVVSPNLIHAAIWLILTLAGVAVNLVLLDADFLAVVQVAVYIDAIAILIVVTVMLTRHAMQDEPPQVNRNWFWGAIAAVLLFAGLMAMFAFIPDLAIDPPELTASSGEIIKQLGQALVHVDQYVLPFEVASILLLAAMVGAILIAIPPRRKSEDGGEG